MSIQQGDTRNIIQEKYVSYSKSDEGNAQIVDKAITPKTCKCGSSSHKRITNKECPLYSNKKNDELGTPPSKTTLTFHVEPESSNDNDSDGACGLMRSLSISSKPSGESVGVDSGESIADLEDSVGESVAGVEESVADAEDSVADSVAEQDRQELDIVSEQEDVIEEAVEEAIEEVRDKENQVGEVRNVIPAVSYHGGKLQFEGIQGSVQVYNGRDVIHDFVSVFPEDTSKVIKDLFKNYKNLPSVKKFRKRKFALESDLMNLSLPNPKKAKSAELVDKLKKIMDRDVRTGLCLLPRHEVSVFLEDYCVKNLASYQDWSKCHQDFEGLDFDKEENQLNKDSTLSDTINAVKRYSSHLKKSEAETMKAAYFVGKAVNLCRTKFRQSWNDTIEEFEFHENTLRNYENLYTFLVEFPRFLRVSISYTALVKYSKKIRSYFQEHEEEARLWRDMKG